MQTSSESEVKYEDKILSSDSEKLRREKFDAILKLQQEKGGLIEIKKHEVLRPGIYLPQPAALPSTASTEEAKEQQDKEMAASGSTNLPSTSRARNSSTKKHQGNNSRKQVTQSSKKQVTQWVKKENSNST